MKKTIKLVIAAACVLLVPGCDSAGPQQGGLGTREAPGNREADRQGIAAILDQFEKAFEGRDASLYASSFSKDAHWENAFGQRQEGRANIERFMTPVYRGFQSADQTIVDTQVHFVTDDVAVAVVTKEIKGQRSLGSDAEVAPRRVRNTSVLRRSAKGWEVSYFEAGDVRRDNEAVR